MQSLIDFMARSLVDHPDKVDVRQHDDEQGTVYELRVAKEDLGKVIGKQGRTVRAMRVLLNAATAKDDKHVVLEIIEEAS